MNVLAMLVTVVLGLKALTVHDPSRFLLTGNGHADLSNTLGGLSLFSAPNATSINELMPEPPAFRALPAWVETYVPLAQDTAALWAPDMYIVQNESHYEHPPVLRMYYAVSTFGSQVSCIGLATASLPRQGIKPNSFVDAGSPIICSNVSTPFNAIDPCPLVLRRDTDSGLEHWLTFGSFWGGIFAVALDPVSGFAQSPAIGPLAVASHGSPAIEASFALQRGEWIYLWVNWGFCCRGVNSTYEIRVGRAKRMGRSFVDKSGKALHEGGGTLFLSTEGDEVGPGQIGISGHDASVFTYHYYDRASGGTPTLGMRELVFDDDAWPVSGGRHTVTDLFNNTKY